MDQPFESDVMADLAADTRIASADGFDGYDGMDESFEQDGFEADAFGADEMAEGMAEFSHDGMDEFGDGFEDDSQGDFWADAGDEFSGDEFNPHRTNQRPSNRPKHQAGQRRRGMDRSGERADNRRQVPRRRPPGHQGPWPPQDNFSDEFFSDEMNEFEDEFGDSFGDEFDDAFTSGDAFAEGDSGDAIDAMEAAIADALEAEDSDEFFRRVVSGVRRAAQVAQRVGRTVGQVARVVGPIAGAIPLPQAQAVARVANIAGRLLADGADEFEALEEMLAFAADENAVDAAAPMIAGLTIRTIMPRAARLNPTTRRQLVRSVRQSTQTLGRRQGPQAVRAVPRVVQAVQRTAQRQRMPAQQLPQAVQRATARVAQNPRLVSQLVRATRQASGVRDRQRRYGGRSQTFNLTGGGTQRLMIRGPVEITIRSR
jgi:hypothetical protein